MPFFSYSQNFEDVLLWRALRHIEGGTYVDIGAQDPISDSVSKAFYEQGWRGLHIEPTTYYADLLRKDRPDEAVIQAAVSSRSGTLNFFEFLGTGLSTADRDIAATHQKNGFPAVEVIVPAMTLDQVFDAMEGQEIHWLKIDVEGWEGAVLKGWRRSHSRPWIVVVEAVVPLTQTETYSSWEPDLLAKGYSFTYFDGLNRYYLSDAHADLVRHFRYGPSLWDGFQLPEVSRAVQSISTRRQEAEDHLRSQLQLSAAESQKLKVQLDVLSGDFGNLSKDLTFAHGTLSEVRTERDRHLAEAAALRVDKMQFEVELSKVRAELSYVHSVLNETRSNLDAVSGSLKQSQEELAQVHLELVRSKEEISRAEDTARQTLENADQLRNQLEQVLAQRTDEFVATKVELERAKCLLEDTHEKLVATSEESALRLSKLEASVGELEQARADTARLRDELDASKLRLRYARLEAENGRSLSVDKVEQIVLLQEALKELSQTRLEWDRVSDALFNERQQHIARSADFGELREELSRVQAEQDRLRSEKSAIEIELDKYRSISLIQRSAHEGGVSHDTAVSSMSNSNMPSMQLDWHAWTLGRSLSPQAGKTYDKPDPAIEALVTKISKKLDEVGASLGEGDGSFLASSKGSGKNLPDYIRWVRPLVWRMHTPKTESALQRLARDEMERALSGLGHVILPAAEAQPDAIEMICDVGLDGDQQASSILLASDWHDVNFPVATVEFANSRLAGIACLSAMGARSAVDRGVAVPCIIAGFGVDHLDRVDVEPSFKICANPFRFLHVSACGADTGIDILLESYGRAFSNDDQVSLVIVPFIGDIPTAIKTLLCELRSKNPHFPDVQLIDRQLSVAELKALYVQCQVFVAPSRSEGFGYPIATAFMCGLPVVATAWGGHLDYCDDGNSWLVDFRFERAEGGKTENWSDVAWASPWPSHLQQALRAAFRATSDERVKRAWRGRRKLLEKFTWKDVAMRVAAFASKRMSTV